MIVGLRSWGVVRVDRRDGHGKVKVNAWIILLSNIRKQIVSSLAESFILEYQFGLLHINNSQMHGVEMLSWFMVVHGLQSSWFMPLIFDYLLLTTQNYVLIR